MSESATRKQYTMRPQGLEKHQRKENRQDICDVILLANGTKYFAHKDILISFSDYFRQYFEDETKNSQLQLPREIQRNEENENSILMNRKDTENKIKASEQQSHTVIHLPGIHPDELGTILEYMYTSTLSLKAENVNEILLAGNLLQIPSIIEFCAEVLLKQPDWRSPLVSSKILNFVKTKGLKNGRPLRQSTIQAPSATTTLTDVTWATKGTRTTTLDPLLRSNNTSEDSKQILHNGNVLKGNGVEMLNKDQQKSPVFQQKRKRRYPWTNTTSNSRSIGHKRTSLKRDTEESTSDEKRLISATCPDQLENEPFSYRQRFLHTSSNQNINKQYSDFAKYSPKHSRPTELISGWISPGSYLSNVEGAALLQQRNNIDAFANETKFIPQPNSNLFKEIPIGKVLSPKLDKYYQNGVDSRDIQPVAPLPHMDGLLHQNLAAAYTSSLALPFLQYQSRYFAYPLLGAVGGIRHVNTFPEFDTNANLWNKYESPQIYAQQVNSKARNQCNMNATLYPPPLLDRRFLRPLVKEDVSSPSLIHREGSFSTLLSARNNGLPTNNGSEINESIKPLDLVCKRSSLKLQSNIMKQNSVSTKSKFQSEDNNLKYGSNIKSDFSTAGKFDQYKESRVTGQERSAGQKNTYVEYHKRKRKLLRAVPGFDSSGFSANGVTNPPNRRHSRMHEDENQLKPVLKGQCSSEDDIIARECHQMDVSDPESDDSGRPSSV